MRREMKYIAIFAIPHVCVIYFCLIMIFLNLAAPFLNGFAVDSKGRVYVGENKTINIYQDCIKVGSIDLEGETYAFAIVQNDHILVAYTSEVCLLDSFGKVLERKEDSYAQTFNEIQSKRRSSVTVGGDRYKKVDSFGWTRIIRNGSEVVYRLNVLSFVVKCLIVLCTVSMFVNGALVIRYVRKLRKTGDDSKTA